MKPINLLSTISEGIYKSVKRKIGAKHPIYMFLIQNDVGMEVYNVTAIKNGTGELKRAVDGLIEQMRESSSPDVYNDKIYLDHVIKIDFDKQELQHVTNSFSSFIDKVLVFGIDEEGQEPTT